MAPIDPYAAFFLTPEQPRHRRYEMVRARFVDKLRIKQIAQRFGAPIAG